MQKLVLAAALSGVVGCTINPENGKTFSGNNVGRVVPFSGYATVAGATMTVEVLNRAKLNPHDPNANWITLATTQASNTPTTIGGDQAYEWSVEATIVPTSSRRRRWPAGGTARLRIRQGNVVAFAFDDLGCVILHMNEGISQVADQCGSHDEGIITLVDTDPLPSLPTFYAYLDRKKTSTEAEAEEYYATINAGPGTERQTLLGWKQENGFSGGITTGGANEVTAHYYNGGDLGLGRQMHCRNISFGGLACYVSNFGSATDGLADEDTAVDLAIAGVGSGATVTMEYLPLQANNVRFYVYDGNGNLTPKVQLDSQSEKIVPGVCLACHGGIYNSDTNTVTGASFLPFDVYTFSYSQQPNYTLAAQQENFRQLNEMVRDSDPAEGIVDLIDGMYANQVGTVGQTPSDNYLPAAWSANANRENITLYRTVVAPYCRTCHIAQTGPFAFLSRGDFDLSADLIETAVCETKEMPHAEITQQKFWQSNARAHLIGALDLYDDGSTDSYDACDAD